jgi:CubicO group peptidase (beta-lactamase class C family)
MVVTSGGVKVRRLEPVKHLFEEQIDKGLHPGAALTVYHQGQLVLDLYGGVADKESGRAVAYITNGFRAMQTNNPRLAAISRAVRDAFR